MTHDRADLIRAVWAKGSCGYLLHEGQLEVRRLFKECRERRFVLCCSRRYGKSFLACVLAIEHALQNTGASVRIAAPTAKMVRNIIEPHMRTILAECPESLRPKHHKQDGAWHFEKTGSFIHVAGCDGGNAERHRGTDCSLAIVEEAGFVDELDYVVDDIFTPQLLTTNGRMMMLSSPPRTPAHPFVAYALSAQERGAYVHRTIHDAPHISERLVEEFCAESGGERSTTWRREYLAQFVVDESRAIVPEFAEAEPDLVQDWTRPEYYDAYVAADFGYKDLTFVVLGYYDFDNDRHVIEDEVILEQSTSGQIAAAIREKERELWGEKEPMRIADADRIVLADIVNQHDMTILPARKDDREAAINALRICVSERRLIIHPRCKALRAHLRNGIWNKARTQFERSGGFGHFDGVAAAVYFVRHVTRGKNPYPRYRRGESAATHWMPTRKDQSRDGEAVASIFRRRR